MEIKAKQNLSGFPCWQATNCNNAANCGHLLETAVSEKVLLSRGRERMSCTSGFSIKDDSAASLPGDEAHRGRGNDTELKGETPV